MQSMNGVYLNHVRLASEVATPVCHGDLITFGIDVSTNALSYVFTNTSKGCPVLIKEGRANIEPRPQRPAKRAYKATEQVSTVKKPRTDGLTSAAASSMASLSSPVPTPTLPKNASGQASRSNSSTPPVTPKKGKSAKRTPIVNIPPKQTPSSSSSTVTVFVLPSSNETTPLNGNAIVYSLPSSSSSVSVVTPPSANTLKSSVSSSSVTIDSLFDTRTVAPQDAMEEAIFGKTPLTPRAQAVLNGVGLSATEIQTQMAQDEHDKEKNKLMSKYQAMKDELAAKDRLLIEKEQEQVKAKDDIFTSIQEEMTCAICQELFISAYTLPCAHSFCEWCITEWMTKNHYRECPVCRAAISKEPVHSIAIDNAIRTLLARLSPEEKKTREITEKEHKESLSKLNVPRSKPPKIFPITPTTDHSPIVITSDDEMFLDLDTDSTTDSMDSVSGNEEEYYGGYGRCYRCGELL